MLLSFCPAFFRWRKIILVTSVERRSKPGLTALEKSILWMPLAQVWRASIAASKPGMGYTGIHLAAAESPAEKREELLRLKFCFWVGWNKYTFVSWC